MSDAVVPRAAQRGLPSVPAKGGSRGSCGSCRRSLNVSQLGDWRMQVEVPYIGSCVKGHTWQWRDGTKHVEDRAVGPWRRITLEAAAGPGTI